MRALVLCAPSSSVSLGCWLLGDTSTLWFLCLQCEMLLSSADVSPSKSSHFVSVLLYLQNTVPYPLPGYSCNGRSLSFHFCVYSAGRDRYVMQGTYLFFLLLNASSGFLLRATLSVLHRFMLHAAKSHINILMGEKRLQFFFYLKRKVSHYWEVSDTQNHTVEYPITHNNRSNNGLAPGQHSYLEHMLCVGKPLTLP